MKGTGAEKLAAQHLLANRVIELLSSLADGSSLPEDRFQSPAALLLAILEETNSLAAPVVPERPIVPLSSSDLLVNSRHDVRIGEPSLKALVARRPGAFRVLTTAYMGATERRALDALVELGADVRVSYDVEHTRLHAKAWPHELIRHVLSECASRHRANPIAVSIPL